MPLDRTPEPELAWQAVRFGRHCRLGEAGLQRMEKPLQTALATDVGWARSIRADVGGSRENAWLSHLLWLEFRASLAQYAYTNCHDIRASAEANAVASAAASERGALLLCARAADGQSAFLQAGDLALRFALKELATLRLTVWMPARGSGGYDLTLELQRGRTSEARLLDGTRSPLFIPDACRIALPFPHAAETSLDLLRGVLHLASALDVAFDYAEVSDV